MKSRVLALAAALGVCASLPAAAQFQKPDDAVKYRQSAFFVMAQHFGRIGAMVNNRVPYDAAAVTANAEIVADLAKLPYAGFVDNTASTAKGGASAKIWTERAKFDAGAKKLQDDVARLLAAAKANNAADVRAAFGAVGQTCKGCHDDYRNN
jgi:cytochrome c556